MGWQDRFSLTGRKALITGASKGIGAEIAAVPADAQGNFVAMFNLAPSPAPRVLSLVMTLL